MMNRIVMLAQKALGHMKNRIVPTAVELHLRQRVAFDRLNPQVEAVKTSPTVQIAVVAAVTGLVLAGRWTTAAGLAIGWFASKPVTRVVAGGIAAVGMIDDRLRAGTEPMLFPVGEPLQPADEAFA
jgi:hypothetical protein